MPDIKILHGNCLDILPTLPDCSVDSIVTDPPYELGFMGKKWDNSGIAYNPDLWAECLRVLKPGGHLLAFGGTRTYHRMAVAIEDAGFEIRDSIHWITGSGFPKSLNVNKATKDTACQCEVNWSHGTGHPLPEHDVRSVRDTDLPQTINASEERREVLLTSVPKQDPPQSWQTGTEPETPDGEQPSVEGRRDLQEREGQLHRTEIRSVSGGVSSDGTQGRLLHGAPSSDGSMGRSDVAAERSGEPHQSRSEGQSAGEPGVISEQRGSQTWRGWQICAGCSKPILPQGWGTALKPAHEPIVVARKPLDGTVAANVLEHGTGALNIDGCRVAGALEGDPNRFAKTDGRTFNAFSQSAPVVRSEGRWPANIVFTHAADCQQVGTRQDTMRAGERTANFGTQETKSGGNGSGDWGSRETTVAVWECTEGCPVRELDQQSGISKSQAGDRRGQKSIFGGIGDSDTERLGHSDSGGASRFFTVTEWDAPFRYVAKPGKRERNAGLDALPTKETLIYSEKAQGPLPQQTPSKPSPRANHHPTVKPVALMRWLVRLVTPPGGTVLEPFAGSGTTLVACHLEGLNAIGIEMTDEYLPIIEGRLEWARQQPAEPDNPQQELEL